MRGQRALRAASLAILVAACTAAAPSASMLPSPTTASSRPDASPSIDPTSALATAQPTNEPETTQEPGPTDVPAEGSAWAQNPREPLLIGAAVRVLAAELNIREEPSTSAKRLDTLGAGMIIVVSGLPPIDADGFTWYQGTGPIGAEDGELRPLPHPADAGIDATQGWFASRKGAVPYVEPVTSRCPTVVDLENLGAMVPKERLDCFGGSTIELQATYGCFGCNAEFFGTFSPAWLANPNEINLVSMVGSNLGGHGLTVRFPPTLDGRPEMASIIRVRGHFDDPAASDCSMALAPWSAVSIVPHVVPTSIARLWCRQMFVVESYQLIGTDESVDFGG